MYYTSPHYISPFFSLRRLDIGSIEGFTDDYSGLICSLIDLYEAGHSSEWLEWAVSLQEKQDELFWDQDPNGGGYFSSSGQDPSVLLQMKEGIYN